MLKYKKMSIGMWNTDNRLTVSCNNCDNGKPIPLRPTNAISYMTHGLWLKLGQRDSVREVGRGLVVYQYMSCSVGYARIIKK